MIVLATRAWLAFQPWVLLFPTVPILSLESRSEVVIHLAHLLDMMLQQTGLGRSSLQ